MGTLRVCLIAAVALLGSACLSAQAQAPVEPKHIRPDQAAPSAVRVTQSDYELSAKTASASAGSIDIVVSNQGMQAHEFVIVPRDGERYGVPIGEIEHFPVGEARAIRMDLKPGRYAFVCLMVSVVDGEPQSHMALGMNTPFEVTE